MSALRASSRATSFAANAQIKCGNYSVSVASPFSQALLDEIGQIHDLYLEDAITHVEISPCAVGAQLPGVHSIKIKTADSREHVRYFRKQEARSESSCFSVDSADQESLGIPVVTEACSKAKAYRLAEKMVGLHLFREGRARLKGAKEKYDVKNVKLGKANLGKVKDVSEKWVIPISDILSIVRNALGLVMVILMLAGMGPLAPAVLGIGIAFGCALVVQGALFAFPQGTFAWGADGASKFMIVRSLKDVKHKWTKGFAVLDGFLSLVEGCLWMALGITTVIPLLIKGGILAVQGAPAIISVLTHISDNLTFALFNVFFSCTFLLMVGKGIRDYRRHNGFRKKLLSRLEKPGVDEFERHRLALEFLRDKMILRMKDKHCSYSKEDLEKKAGRMLYRITEQMDSDMIDKLKNADDILERMKDRDKLARLIALGEAQEIVEAALLANKINLTYDKWTIGLGLVGAVVGGAVYNVLHAFGFNLLAMACDFAAWIPLNAGFLFLDVDWVIPSIVEGNFKETAKEKLFDPVILAFGALGRRLSALGSTSALKEKTA